MSKHHKLSVFSIICLLLASYSLPGFAGDSMQLVVTGSNRAIVLFNQERLVLSVGSSSHPRVTLMEADSERAVLDIDGKQHVLESGGVAAPILQESEPVEDTGEDAVVTLWADPSGFFFARGRVNRRSTRFLVDTGADTVTFSSTQADRLGIDYKNGRSGYASTASGVARLKSVTLNRVSIEGITLRNVAANVILGRFPEVPLLGSSFLNKLHMVRTGKKWNLEKISIISMIQPLIERSVVY
jgi:aspartyl protease family protein